MLIQIKKPHRDNSELDLLTDVLSGELNITEVLFDIEGKLAVFIRLDDAFTVRQADDDALHIPKREKYKLKARRDQTKLALQHLSPRRNSAHILYSQFKI